MIRSQAVEIIARRLNLNAGRVAALAQRIAEAGLLPKARGRDIPSLGHAHLSKLLLCAIADRGLGEAARSTEAYAGLSAPNGAVLFDIAEGWISGAVPVAGVEYLVLQIAPEPAATIISRGGDHLNFGPERSRDAAARNVIIPGNSISAITAEFRGATPDKADYATVVGRLAAALI